MVDLDGALARLEQLLANFMQAQSQQNKMDVSEVVTKLQNSNQSFGQLIKLLTGILPRAQGNFTMTATASLVVVEPKCNTSSYVWLIPTNAAAGTLLGSNKNLFLTYQVGTFTVTTASGIAATGAETFQYLLFNPL